MTTTETTTSGGTVTTTETTRTETTTTPGLDDQVLAATIGTLELFAMYLGDRLGLYQVLAGGTACSAPELAAAAGIHPRYAREWLEQQAVSGVLDVDDVGAGPDERRYSLPAGNAEVVVEATSLRHVAPLARMMVGVAGALDEVASAFRTGDGVPYARYGADFRSGQGAVNRPAFSTMLVEDWIPAMRDAAARLHAGGRVADLACGQGWSTIAVARAFPDADVIGVDLDTASIDDARAIALHAGADVRFESADAAALAAHGPFDLILLLEALHDLAQPVEVLAAARTALAPGGAVLVADEAVASSFSAPGDDMERFMYGFSVVHCLPASMAEQPSAATGTVIRESTVRQYATAAGFSTVEVLDVDGGFFRLYELRD